MVPQSRKVPQAKLDVAQEDVELLQGERHDDLKKYSLYLMHLAGDHLKHRWSPDLYQ